MLRAHDKKTGAVVASIPIPAVINSVPMTYAVGGKQYIAFWVSNQSQDPATRLPSTLITLALPAAK